MLPQQRNVRSEWDTNTVLALARTEMQLPRPIALEP